MTDVIEIIVDSIVCDQNMQRLEMDDEALEDLVASVRRLGVLLPVAVVPRGDSYVLLAGHRRIAAARRVGLEKVSAIVFDGSGHQANEVMFAENFYRKDLSGVERASAIKDAVDGGAVTVGDIAKMFHRSEHWVAAQIAMVGWPSDVLSAIHYGKLSVSAAGNLAAVDDDVYREFLVRQAVDGGATARTTAAWLQAYRAQAPPSAAVEAEPLAGPGRAEPMVPQAPCLACGQVYRTDQLSHVPICCGCIQAIRSAG